MDVASLLQSVANQMTAESAPYVPEMNDVETQTQTWNELTLQMVSDVVSHQIISMKTLDSSTTDSFGASKSCIHTSGMAWKDIAQIMVNSHKNLCQNTGFEVVENIVKVTVDQPFSAVDFIKTSVEVYISAENEKAKETIENLPEPLIEDTKDVEMSKIVDAGAILLKESSNLTLQVDHLHEPQSELPLEAEHNVIFEQRKALSLNDCNTDKQMQSPLVLNNQPESKLKSIASDMESITPHQKSQTECLQLSTSQPSINSNNIEVTTKLNAQTSEIAIQEFEDSNKQNSNVIQSDNLEENCADESEKIDKGIVNKNEEIEKVAKQNEVLKVSDNKSKDTNENDVENKTVGESSKDTNAQIKHKCPICRKYCRTRKQLDRHIENHKSTENEKSIGFECEVCNMVFQSRWKLNKHKPRHDPDHDIHPCLQCDKVCKTVQSLRRHQRIHIEGSSFSCKKCGLTFRVFAKLKQHMSKEHGIYEEHVCKICGSVYRNEVTLKDHMFEHSGKEFPCTLCNKTFRRPELLRCHMFRHKTKSKPKAFKCSMCTSSYVEERQLQVHIRLTHIKERNYVCIVCDKKFFYQYQLLTHEKIHSGIKEFKCRYCKKEFIKQTSLVTHEMVHTGSKPWKCSHCTKGFATKGHKQRHEKTHTDKSKPEPVFQCNSCPSKFRYKGQLSDHMKRHAGVKDHVCHFCRKGYVSRSDLVRHLRMHTGGKPHKCSYCDETFSKRMELSKHELTHGN